MPGTTNNAANDFVLNANPTNTPHQTNVRNRPESTAANPTPHAANINKINNGSTPLSRDTATNDGNTPTPTPPPTPATTPNRGATIRYNNHTANTAHTPSGTNKLNDAKTCRCHTRGGRKARAACCLEGRAHATARRR